MSMTKMVGIDFGTTNIRIAEWDADSGEYPSSNLIGEGRLSHMPAVIGFRRQRGGEVERLFGETADRLDDARNVIVIRNIKRFALASDDYVREQLEADLEQKGETWDSWFDPDSRSIRVWSETVHVEEAIRLLLKEAISRAGLAGAAAEWRAGCPVNSDLIFRKALVAALEDLGCQGRIEWTVEEPLLLLALGREISSLDDGIYMVYDLGGGSFDCAVVKVTSNQLIVLADHGLPTLGGMNIDEMLKRELEYDGPPQELRTAKEQLSTTDKIDLAGGYTLSIELVHRVLENEGFMRRTPDAMEKAYNKAQLLIDSPEEEGVKGMVESIDKVLVVGGPTQMPYFLEKLRDAFGYDKVVSADELTLAADRADILDPALTALSHGACLMYGKGYVPLTVDRVPAEIVLSVTDGQSVEEDGLQPYRKLPHEPPLAPHVGQLLVRRPLYAEMTTLNGDVDSEYSVTVRSPDGDVLGRYGPYEMRMPRDYTGPRADRIRLLVDRLGGIKVRLEAGFTHIPSPSFDVVDVELNPPWQPDLQREIRLHPNERGPLQELLEAGREELAASPYARTNLPYGGSVHAAYGQRQRRA